jgi:hypothetical protein
MKLSRSRAQLARDIQGSWRIDVIGTQHSAASSGDSYDGDGKKVS